MLYVPRFLRNSRFLSPSLHSPYDRKERRGEEDKEEKGGTFTVLKVPRHGPLVL